MAYSESCREKLTQYKIKGQSRPFVDPELQIQLPGYEAESLSENSSYIPIYSHYSGACPLDPSLTIPINEAELYHVMAEAENSYEAWQKMKHRLTDVLQKANSKH